MYFQLNKKSRATEKSNHPSFIRCPADETMKVKDK